jgi:beta-barrel assembly-enhancing protease
VLVSRLHKTTLIALLCSAAVSSCAGPQLRVPTASPVAISLEQQRQLGLLQDQQDLAFTDLVGQWRRVFAVYSQLRTGGAELCNSDVAPFWGLWLTDVTMFEPQDRDRAKRLFNFDNKVSILAVSGNAAKAGFRPGDTVTRINGSSLPWSSGLSRAVELLKRAGMRSTEIEVAREGKLLTTSLAPEIACRYPVMIKRSSDIETGTNGYLIEVDTVILGLASNDDELAHVLGHEMAHNVLGHNDRRKANASTGAILGTIVDIGLLVGARVNTQGAFGKAGANAGRLAYSQDFEREADYMSLYFMLKSGFDVAKAADVQRKLGVYNPGSIVSGYGSTHPSSPERAANLEQGLQEIRGKLASNEPLVPTNLKNQSDAITVATSAIPPASESYEKVMVENKPVATQVSALKPLAPETKPITKTYASLVQYDGPKVKSGVTLEAEFNDDGSGSGPARVVYPGNRYVLDGSWTTLPAGKIETPKLIEKKALNALRLAADVPLTTSRFSNNDVVLECLYGETAAYGQRKGECQDNYGNKYHLVVRP